MALGRGDWYGRTRPHARGGLARNFNEEKQIIDYNLELSRP